jgi:hypothetical protein
VRVTAPEQHAPPVYACAAGAVLHAHAADTLEPAVLLHTFLPPGAADRLVAAPLRVDVNGNGRPAESVTVRVLAQEIALTWELPVAPFVAALPGQPGDEGRMVLLAVIDTEPETSFWARPVDCEQLAAELQLPVADLTDALRGRLTPWLADDLEGLLHDDAHDRAVDRSPAQTLATAVLAHYRGDLDATQSTSKLVRAAELAPDDYSLELGRLLCSALATATEVTTPAHREALLAATGPFETESLRLLGELPGVLADVDDAQRTDATMHFLLDGDDRDETLRAAVSVVARLAREAFGPDLPDDEVLRRLEMLDDRALMRLARLWVDLAAAAAGDDAGDLTTLATRVQAEGRRGATWLRATAVVLAGTAVEAARRTPDRVAEPLQTVRRLVDQQPPLDAALTAEGLRACVDLARYVRARAGVGPARWLRAPVSAAVSAVADALVEGLDREVAVDLFDALLEDDVDGVDLLDGFVCTTAQLLVDVEPRLDDPLRRAQVGDLLGSVAAGPRGARWLLTTLLREAPEHDPGAADLTPVLPSEPPVDADRAATKAGRAGMLRLGLVCLDALAAAFAEEATLGRDELLALALPTALAEHDLLRRAA